MSVLIGQRSFIAQVKEVAGTNTMTRATPFEITVTSSGASSITSTSELTSANAYAYLGNWIEILNGNIPGEMVRVLSFDPATDTVTTDAFSATPSGVTRARMWIPPEPLCAVTGNASADTTHFDCAGRTEADDTFNDPDRLYAVAEGVGGANALVRGESQLVSDFATSGDKFTVASAYSALPASGDLFVLRQPIKAVGELVLPEVSYGVIERKFVKGQMDQDPAVHGPRGGTYTLTMEAHGCSTASSGATAAIPPLEAGDELSCLFTTDFDGSSAVVTGSSTTQFDVTGGTGSRFAVGAMILVGSEARWITTIATDTITVSPALSAIPAAGVTVYGGCNYTPKTTSHGSMTVETYLGSAVRRIVYGWMPNLEIEGLVSAELPRWKFSGPFDSHVTNDVAAPYTPVFTSAIPRATKGSCVWFDGTAQTGVLAAGFNVGYVIEPKTSVNGLNGKDGHLIVDRKTVGTLSVWMENANEVEFFEQAQERSLVIQVGSVPTQTIAIGIPALQISDCKIAAEGGGFKYDLTYNVLRSNLSGVSDFILTLF